MKQVLCYRGISLLGLWLILCYGCEREYLTYQSKEKDRVYVTYKDTLKHYFAGLDMMDSVQVSSGVYIMGTPKEYDRVVHVSIVDSLTTAKDGIHFSLGDVVIKAGSVWGVIPWTFYRDRDTELANRPVVISFCLKGNENFDLMPGRDTCIYYYKIEMETVKKPNYWDESYLGPYSEKLYSAFLDQYLGLEHTRPSVYRILTDTYGYKFTRSYETRNLWNYHGYMVVKYIVHPLYDYYNENPDPDVDIPTPIY